MPSLNCKRWRNITQFPLAGIPPTTLLSDSLLHAAASITIVSHKKEPSPPLAPTAAECAALQLLGRKRKRTCKPTAVEALMVDASGCRGRRGRQGRQGMLVQARQGKARQGEKNCIQPRSSPVQSMRLSESLLLLSRITMTFTQ